MFKVFLTDMLSYCYTPKWTPTLATAILVVSVPYMLDLFGLLWGCFSSCGLYLFIKTYYLQSSIIAKRSRRYFGLSLGLVLYTIIGSTFVLEAMSESLRVLFALSLILSCFSTIRFITTKPLSKHKNTLADMSGIVKQSVQSQALEGSSNSELPPSPDMCCICLVDKDTLSFHCHECNICVLDLDYHSAFLNNCVGRGNRRLYVLALLSWTITYMLLILCIYYYHLSLSPELLTSFRDAAPGMVLLILLSVGAVTSLMTCLYMQFLRVARETTYYSVSHAAFTFPIKDLGIHIWCKRQCLMDGCI